MNNLLFLIQEITIIHIFVPIIYCVGAKYLYNEIKYTHSIFTYITYIIKTWLNTIFTTALAQYLMQSTTINYIYFDELLRIITFSIIFDVWFYFFHRLCHDIQWIKKYHMIHHMAQYVTPLDGVIIDPVDGFISNFFAAFMINYLNMHLITHSIIIFIAHILIFINHSEYDNHHMIHHKSFNYNYGATSLLDRLMRTHYNLPSNDKFNYFSYKCMYLNLM